MLLVKSVMKKGSMWCDMLALEPALVEECIPPIP